MGVVRVDGWLPTPLTPLVSLYGQDFKKTRVLCQEQAANHTMFLIRPTAADEEKDHQEGKGMPLSILQQELLGRSGGLEAKEEEGMQSNGPC